MMSSFIFTSSTQALSKKLYSLEETGQTALGPALLAAVTLASQRPRSHVIVCTDGLANIGLGSFEDTTGTMSRICFGIKFFTLTCSCALN